MTLVKNFCKKHKLEILCLTIFSLGYVVFCNYLMIELPHMSWFEQMPLVSSYYESTLTFSKLSNSYSEHGMLGYNILFLLNVIVFKLTTFFDVYINDINVTIVGFISIYYCRKYSKDTKSIMYKVCVILISLFAFNFMQLSSGAMETQVRLGVLFFVISTIMINKILTQDISLKFLISTTLIIFVSINIFGTLYSFAAIPILFIITLISYIKYKKVSQKNIIILSTYLICIVIYFIQYSLIGKGEMKSGTLSDLIFQLLKHPKYFVEGMLAYNASTILGYPVYVDKILSNNIYLFIGLIITLIFIYAIYRFIKTKMYIKTYLPILFIAYSFFVFILVIIGRNNDDWGWYVSFWYTVHTKFAAIGTILIFSYDISTSKHRIKILNLVFISILFCGIVYGNCVELRRVPYERQYYLEKQPYLFAENINELPVDQNGNTPLLHTPQMTMNSINILKKYRLSVYRYYDAYEKMQINTGKLNNVTLENYKILKGVFDDKWTERTVELLVPVKSEGKIIINGYYPKNITGNEKIKVFANDKYLMDYTITNTNFTIEIPQTPNSNARIKLESNFSFKADAPDIRELSFILLDIANK